MSKDECQFEELIRERTKGFTRRGWVFEAIADWFSEGEAPLFLLTGEPGSGKSSAAAQLVCLCRAADKTVGQLSPALVYAHFCQARHRTTLDPLNFIRCLANALAKRCEAYRLALVKQDDRQLFEINQTVGTVSGQGQVVGIAIGELQIGHVPARAAFNRVILQPLKDAYRSGFDRPLLIVVDGLDEAVSYEADDNVASLMGVVREEATALPPQVRFFLTSRMDPRITHHTGPPALDLVDDAPDRLAEVEAFARWHLRGLPEAQRRPLAKAVAEASGGNFLCARHLLYDAQENPDRHHLTAPPEPLPLAEVYRRYLHRELGSNPDRWDAEYSPFLGLLAASRGDGLTRQQLMGISGLTRRKYSRLMRVCDQFLAGVRPEGPFRIYHESFRDFLLEDDTMFVDPLEDNERIAQYALELHQNEWSRCEDRYALEFVIAHLTAALDAGPPRALADRLLEQLARVATDYNFLGAKARQLGIEALLRDLRLVLDHLPPKASDREAVTMIVRILQREARNLLDWRPERDPARFAQQVYFRAAREEWPPLREPAQEAIRSEQSSFWRLRWLAQSPGATDSQRSQGHEGAILATAVAPDGRFGFTAGDDHTIRVWDLKTGQLVRVLVGHEQPVTALAVTADARLLVSTAEDHTVRTWNVGNGAPRRVLAGHWQNIAGLVLTDDGQLAVTAGADCLVGVWHVGRGRPMYMLDGHDDCVEAVAVLPHSYQALSVSVDKTMRLWDLMRGRQLKLFYAGEAPFTAVAVSSDASFAISAADDGTMVQWDLLHQRALRRVKGDGVCVSALAISARGDRAVGAAEDGSLRVWNLSSGNGYIVPPGHRQPVSEVKIGTPEDLAISISDDRTLRAWLMTSGQPLARVAVSGPLHSMARTRDGAVLTGDLRGNVYCLELATAEGEA